MSVKGERETYPAVEAGEMLMEVLIGTGFLYSACLCCARKEVDLESSLSWECLRCIIRPWGGREGGREGGRRGEGD